ncbi:MAG: 4-hydroxyacetophenone monooxygenase, partial [Mycobacterium sp.]
LDKSVWTMCTSWYRSARGSISTNWPSPTFLYRLRTRRPRRHAYVLSPHVLSHAVSGTSSSEGTREPALTPPADIPAVSIGVDSAE